MKGLNSLTNKVQCSIIQSVRKSLKSHQQWHMGQILTIKLQGILHFGRDKNAKPNKTQRNKPNPKNMQDFVIRELGIRRGRRLSMRNEEVLEFACARQFFAVCTVCPRRIRTHSKYAFIKKSTIFAQYLCQNEVLMSISWGPHFDQVS